jgi:2-keto-3-deoxy-L-rhamnonate aldolase RhmA
LRFVLTVHVYQLPGVTDTAPEGESVFSIANKHVAIIPQIESRVGIENLEAIVKLDEISAFMIGGGFDFRVPYKIYGSSTQLVTSA